VSCPVIGPAGEHGARLRGHETINHQSPKHFCAEAVRKHQGFGATRWTPGEQLKGSESFAVRGNAGHVICARREERGLRSRARERQCESEPKPAANRLHDEVTVRAAVRFLPCCPLFIQSNHAHEKAPPERSQSMDRAPPGRPVPTSAYRPRAAASTQAAGQGPGYRCGCARGRECGPPGAASVSVRPLLPNSDSKVATISANRLTPRVRPSRRIG
jgi:hypothetical protein